MSGSGLPDWVSVEEDTITLRISRRQARNLLVALGGAIGKTRGEAGAFEPEAVSNEYVAAFTELAVAIEDAARLVPERDGDHPQRPMPEGWTS